MGLSDEDLDQLLDMGETVCREGGSLLPALRPRFPGLVLSQCPASDVVESPCRTGSILDLHLLDTRGHCWGITSDREAATGVLFALHGRAP